MRMRGQKRLARAERSGVGVDQPSLNPLSVVRVLQNDPHYRRFMATMFIFGLGNLMIDAPLAIILQEQFHLGYWPSILITSSLSDIMMLVAIPMWARLLNRWHIVQFRAIHAWSYVLAAMLSLIACVTHQVWLMFVMAVIKGLADAGGALAWNLGHHDFAKDHNASQYMGVHVTLQGIRGLMAPFLGVGIYQLFEHWKPGFGVWAFAPCLALNMSGAAGFGLMWRELRHKLRPHSRQVAPITPVPLDSAVSARDA
jgi:MFS family permease